MLGFGHFETQTQTHTFMSLDLDFGHGFGLGFRVCTFRFVVEFLFWTCVSSLGIGNMVWILCWDFEFEFLVVVFIIRGLEFGFLVWVWGLTIVFGPELFCLGSRHLTYKGAICMA